MDYLLLADKITIALSIAIFAIGLATIFLRRIAIWALIGQITALKSVAASAFLLSRFSHSGGGDLVVVSLIALGMVPSLAIVGTLVLQRCGRFGGSLDTDEEEMLRH